MTLVSSLHTELHRETQNSTFIDVPISKHLLLATYQQQTKISPTSAADSYSELTEGSLFIYTPNAHRFPLPFPHPSVGGRHTNNKIKQEG